MTALLQLTAGAAIDEYLDGADPAELEKLAECCDIVSYEIGGLAERIEASKKNGTPVPHPTKPLNPRPAPRPKAPPPPPPPPSPPKKQLDCGVEDCDCEARECDPWFDPYLDPTGLDAEGNLRYARTELDDRLGALLDQFKAYEEGVVNPVWADVERAFNEVSSPHYLPLAREAVEVLTDLVHRGEDRRDWLSGDLWRCGHCTTSSLRAKPATTSRGAQAVGRSPSGPVGAARRIDCTDRARALRCP